MKLCIVADKLDITGGGSNHSLDLTARGLTERGVDTSLITVNIDGQNVFPKNHPYTIVETNLAGGSRVSTVRNTLDVLRGLDVDLIHVFDPSLAPIVALHARSTATPVICRLNTYTLFCTNNDVMDGKCYKNCTLRKKIAHAPGSTRNNLKDIPKFAFDDLMSPYVLRHVDKFFALSPAVRDVYAENGIPKSRISIVPNFYDPEFVGDSCEADFVAEDISRLLFVGRLHRKKGVDILIQAVSKLDDVPNVDIIGEGPQRTALEQLVADLNLDMKVTFHGWVDYHKLPGYYQKADVFVHPGRWPEPFGRTILEALQCGCVPIVSDIGGPPWILNEASLTFPAESPDALVRKIEHLRSTDLTDISNALASKICEYSPDLVLNQIYIEYRSCLQ